MSLSTDRIYADAITTQVEVVESMEDGARWGWQ